MVKLAGFLKIALVLAMDFCLFYELYPNPAAAGAVTAIAGLYVWLGGYLALLREGAVRWDRLSDYDAKRLETAKAQLAEDARRVSAVNLTGLKLYLVPGEADLQATAYGANCVSVTQGTFEQVDPLTLNAVLAHEVSHILHRDAEFSRGVFCSVLLVFAALSAASAVSMVLLFLLFLCLGFFGSWAGLFAYRGVSKLVCGLFRLIQRCFVLLYRGLMSLASRQAEYRSDLYALRLGYGLQLAHFLSYAAPDSHRQLTLTEAMYRSHPPTQQRIARLEERMRLEAKI